MNAVEVPYFLLRDDYQLSVELRSGKPIRRSFYIKDEGFVHVDELGKIAADPLHGLLS